MKQEINEPWEKRIQADFRAGKYSETALSPQERRRIRESAKRPPLVFRKEKSITLRINGEDLDALRRMAYRAGKKYQTLIGEILHRAAARAP